MFLDLRKKGGGGGGVDKRNQAANINVHGNKRFQTVENHRYRMARENALSTQTEMFVGNETNCK